MIGSIEVAGNCLLTKNTLDAIYIIVAQLKVLNRLIEDRCWVIGLLIHAETYFSHETIIVELYKLTSTGQNGFWNTREFEIELVNFDSIGITNDWSVGFTIDRVVEPFGAKMGEDINIQERKAQILYQLYSPA